MLAYDGDKGTHYQSSMTRAQQESETALLWESLSQFLSASITSLRGRLAAGATGTMAVHPRQQSEARRLVTCGTGCR